VRNFKFTKAGWFSDLNPRKEEVKRPVEKVHHMSISFVLVSYTEERLTVFHPRRSHLHSFPFNIQLETVFEYHRKSHFYVVIVNFEQLFAEVFIPDLNCELISHVHLIFSKNESRCSTIEKACAQRNIIPNNINKTWNS
jgi:hypothetical protein